jgi:hypothetical protein
VCWAVEELGNEGVEDLEPFIYRYNNDAQFFYALLEKVRSFGSRMVKIYRNFQARFVLGSGVLGMIARTPNAF